MDRFIVDIKMVADRPLGLAPQLLVPRSAWMAQRQMARREIASEWSREYPWMAGRD